MTQSKFENLSAFIDGEQTDSESLEQLLSDKDGSKEELAAKWQSYHIIKDGLRNDLPETLQLNIADAVAARLENEPAIIATPEPKKRSIPLLDNVIPLFRQGGQYAIAASVAIAMILGYQQLNYVPENQGLNIAPVKAISGIQSGLSPVSLQQEHALPRADIAEKRRKLNALLVDHQQQMLLKTSDIETLPEIEVNAETQSEEATEQK